MPLSPYISFAGNCADAIAYYQKTLGAELLYKINFGEMPKTSMKANAGLITWQQTEKSKWTGRKPSGPTVSVK